MWGQIEQLRDLLFPGEGAAGAGVWWGHPLPTGAWAAVGGQARVPMGAVLTGSNPGCSSSPGIPLPRTVVEMASLAESPVCS